MPVKLSIIIPVYRVEATLDRCLQSVVSQKFRDFELILVDDGSPDKCPQMCDEWARRDQRIRVIHKENGGLSDARNAGLSVAKGEFVTFVDSDDFLAPETYEQTMPLASHADIVEYPFFWHYGAKDQHVCPLDCRTYDDAADYWLRGNAYEHTYACNKLFRRTLFEDVSFPVGKVFEDAWTLPRLLRKARRVVTCGKGLYYYCYNQQGITAQAGGQELALLLEAHQQILPTWCDDRYYMHVLNIQLDVCRLTGAAPVLPKRRVNPLKRGLTATQSIKAIILNSFGIKGLCKINKKTHRS